jgi:hypothetical protein
MADLIRVSRALRIKLESLKQPGESFDALIRRLAGLERSLSVAGQVKALEAGGSVVFPWPGREVENSRLSNTVRMAVERAEGRFTVDYTQGGVQVARLPSHASHIVKSATLMETEQHGR